MTNIIYNLSNQRNEIVKKPVTRINNKTSSRIILKDMD